MRRHRLRSRAGQALVEYAVILALIGAGLTAVLLVLRNGVGGAYEETGARLDSVACGMGRSAVCPAPADPGEGSDGGGGHGGGNGRGNHGNGNGNGGGDGSNGGGNNGNGDGNGGGNGNNGRGGGPAR